MAETQELIVDFDNAKSGRINLDLGVYTATTGWDECGTGRTNPFRRWRAYFSFDTSALPDDAVIQKVTMMIRRRGDGLGLPETYRLKFNIGTFIGANLDGNAGEWTAGTLVQTLTVKPADKQAVVMDVAALALVNRTGDTDLKLWDDSTQGSGDPTWETNFNPTTLQRCRLAIQYTEPRAAVATGVGTASASATLVIPGAATATGIGTASAVGVQVLPQSAVATGVGTASATAMMVLTGGATATGVGTATAAATVTGNIAYWGEPCERYTGGPRRAGR